MKIKIRKNKHYPFPYYPFPSFNYVNKSKPEIWIKNFTFTDSCLYDLKDSDQYDLNKLYGFSIGHHHNNSFRFGWRPNLNNKKIEIFAYEYRNKKRYSKFITAININKSYFFKIKYYPETCLCEYTVYNGTSTSVTMNGTIKNNYGLGYKLKVYFGGNEKAPQDIIIIADVA